MSVTVTADPAHPAGHALIRVSGAATSAGSPGFRVQRDAGWGDDKLGPGGWQSSDALLQPDRAERDGADLLLSVGWAVCQHLEAGVYEVSVPAADVEPTGVFWPDIVPLHTGAARVLPPPAPEPVPTAKADPPETARPVTLAPVLPEAPIQPQVTPPATGASAGGTRWAALGGGLLVLLLASGGIYYAVNRPTPAAPPQLVETPPAPPPPAPSGPPALGALSVPDVLAKAPDAAAIRAEGEQRLRGDRKDDGLLLLEAASDRSDPGAAAALAKLYDPVVFQPGGAIPKPDARQSARYYRDAARGGVDVVAARDALQRRLQQQAQNGDLGADLMLKDFWP